MKAKFYFLMLLFLIGSIGIVCGQTITGQDAIFMSEFSKPKLNIPFSDPKFGTTVTRISDAVKSKINGIIPDYSKRQAWNADETKMLLRTGDGEVMLCDGNTYDYIKTLQGVAGEDIFWHTSNPEIIYYSADSILYSYNISSDELTTIHVFTDYTWANTRGEGNMSSDGRYYAVVGQKYNYKTGEVIFKDLLVYDMQTNSVVSKKSLPKDSLTGFDWVSISPLGNYVVVDYADEETGRYHGVEVYDRNFKLIWQKPLGAGHSDMGLEANGDEILVMDIYDAAKNITTFKKFRLSDGQTTDLLSISPLFDQHISLRNTKDTGWCLISTFDYTGRLKDDSLSWLPFEDEVFKLKLDGSGEVKRLAHHHSRRFSPTTPDSDNSVYWAEPHATTSRKGDRIIFASNWRQNISKQNGIDVYLIDLRK